MKTLFVVDHESEWPQEMPGFAMTTAGQYLTSAAWGLHQHDRVVNLCRCDRAQGSGSYVSLLAEARGQEAFPSTRTLEDLRRAPATVPVLEQFTQLTRHELAQSAAPELVVDSYFGCDPSGRHTLISRQLFALLKTPLVRAVFVTDAGGWRLSRVRASSLMDVPATQRAALWLAARQFANGQAPCRDRTGERWSIAILHTPSEPLPPSNPAALEKLLRAAETLGMRAQTIDRHAIDRLEEFDALFIRDTTYVGHYTYDFSQRALALGLIVIDDPDSILRCNNKVYLNALLHRHGIPVPRTLTVHRANVGDIVPTLGLPCVLKQPDGGFSLGVRRASSADEVRQHARELLARSELIIAQEFLATPFDWRVAILDRRPLYVCKYFMAPGHWQVHKFEPGRHLEGPATALSVGEAPQSVVHMAALAANAIGSGLYGVDLKQSGEQCVVLEVNDNPNIDAGVEDDLLKDALYRELMGVFLRRIKERRQMIAG